MLHSRCYEYEEEDHMILMQIKILAINERKCYNENGDER